MGKYNNFLTRQEEKVLLKIGYKTNEFPQIAYTKDCVVITNLRGKKVKQTYAKKILGINDFISAIARASFHCSSSRFKGGKYFCFEDRIPMGTKIPKEYFEVRIIKS